MVVATQNCADHKLSSRRSSLKCFLHSCFPKKRDVSVRNDEAKFLSGKLSNSLLSTHWDSRGSSRESSRTVTTSATTVTTPRATCKSPPSMSPRLPAASHFRADDSSVSPAVFYTPQQDVFPQTQHTARGSSRAFIRSFFTLFWATPRRQGLRCYFRKSALRNPDTATQPTLTTETLFRSLPDLSERSTRSSGSSSFCTALSRTDMDTVTPLGLTRAQIANDGRHTHLGSGTNVKGNALLTFPRRNVSHYTQTRHQIITFDYKLNQVLMTLNVLTHFVRHTPSATLLLYCEIIFSRFQIAADILFCCLRHPQTYH